MIKGRHTIKELKPNLSLGCPGSSGVSNGSYMDMYFSLKGGPPMEHTSSHEISCRCCGEVEYTFHVFKPVGDLTT